MSEDRSSSRAEPGPGPKRVQRAPGAERALARTVVVLALAFACGEDESAHARHEPATPATSAAPAGATVARTPTATERGRYRISARPESEPVAIGRLHRWLVRVEDATGAVLFPERLRFDAGMPQHGHGLPTAPRVTERLPSGELAVDGVKFHMAGEWSIVVDVDGPAGPDRATLRVAIGP